MFQFTKRKKYNILLILRFLEVSSMKLQSLGFGHLELDILKLGDMKVEINLFQYCRWTSNLFIYCITKPFRVTCLFYKSFQQASGNDHKRITCSVTEKWKQTNTKRVDQLRVTLVLVWWEETSYNLKKKEEKREG